MLAHYSRWKTSGCRKTRSFILHMRQMFMTLMPEEAFDFVWNRLKANKQWFCSRSAFAPRKKRQRKTAKTRIQHNLWCFTWLMFMRCVGKHLLRSSRSFDGARRVAIFISDVFSVHLNYLPHLETQKQVSFLRHGRLNPHFCLFICSGVCRKVILGEKSAWEMTFER
jgi:hypothetical protein